VGFLTPALYDELYFLWKQATENDSKSPMRRYQDLLEEIAEWDESKKLQVTDRCIEKSGCKFLEDLLTAVFVAHTKVLMSIRNKSKVSKESYKLQVPTSNRFVYECLVQCARDFWKSPYLFYQNEADNKIDKIQIQKNMRIAEGNVKDAIMETIRNLLPIKDVLGSVLEMNEDGGVVVEIANQPKKETIVKESMGNPGESPRRTPGTNSGAQAPSPVPTPEGNIKPPQASSSTSSNSQVSEPSTMETTTNLLEEVQKGFEKSKPESFQKAELGLISGKNTESKTDDEEEVLETDDEGVTADDPAGFDWNTIVVGPVDDTIESSLVEDIESLDPPGSQEKADMVSMDDILGAVEEV
jgi:hypothetical protein